MAFQSIQISNFSWGGMPPDPPRMSCYAAELPSATMIYSSQFILVATLTLGPLHFWIASYGPAGMSMHIYRIGGNLAVCTRMSMHIYRIGGNFRGMKISLKALK